MEPDGNPGSITENNADALPLYSEDSVLLAGDGGTLTLSCGAERYGLSSNRYEPCVYITLPGGSEVTLHNAFTTDELYEAARTGGKIRLMTGHEYDLGGICRLLLLAARLGADQPDVGYVEGRMFIGTLERLGAFSPETAADLAPYGLVNRNIMGRFIHSGRVGVTADGKYFIKKRYK